MQLHDILQLRTSVILPEAISDGGLAPTTDTSLFLTTWPLSFLQQMPHLKCMPVSENAGSVFRIVLSDP